MKKLLVISILCGLFIITVAIAALSYEQQRQLNKQMNELFQAVDSLTVELKQLNNNIKTAKVIVTYYHPNSLGINADSDPGKTAFMKVPIPGRTIAISRELYEKGWGGHKIYIPGFGVGVAEDLMGRSVKGLHVDICVASKKEAMQKGKRTAVITRLIL